MGKFCIAVGAILLVIGLFMALGAQAHNGGMAKDGCHKDNKANERHWHFANTKTRAGICSKSGEKFLSLDVLLTPTPVPAICKELLTDFQDAWSVHDADKLARQAIDKGCWAQ